mgnify:CR=1 FL=1
MYWRYGLLGLSLAFVSLPLYVTLPHHYASHHALSLESIGALLLITRLADAAIDPWLGRWIDRTLQRGQTAAWRLACLAGGVMTMGFIALWFPPAAMQQPHSLLLWLGATLALTCLGYSALSILHQAWGSRWGGSAMQRTRVVAARELAALVGVLVASTLPSMLGLSATSAALVLALLMGIVTLKQTPLISPHRTEALPRPPHAPPPQGLSNTAPWQSMPFLALLAVFIINGMASAIPATLLPFFVQETLGAPHWQPLFLVSYFLAAAAAMPLWMKLVRHWGLVRCWQLAMLGTVLTFGVVPWLGAGDTLAFWLVCVSSGIHLGADLAIPGALLTGVIVQAGCGGQAEGRFLGWWTAAPKLNLALAAGLALPLLAAAGFAQGGPAVANQNALAWTYGVLPCVLKLVSLAALHHASQRFPAWKDPS